MPFLTGTATDYLDLLDILVDFAVESHVNSVAVNAGGTGYTLGDVLTVAGGTVLHTLPATLEVTGVSAGVITAVKLLTGGIYTVDPTLTANAVTGGTGSGATIDLTMDGGGLWAVNRDQTYATTEREVLFQGIGSGADEVYVGIRTYRDAGPDIFNWEIAGMTGYAVGLSWDLQPGISPGRHDAAAPTTDGGCFIPLDDASIPFWISVTGRRMIMVARPGTASYMHMYLGFLDPFSTVGEWPYPLCVAGASCQRETRFNSTRGALSGLCDPVSKQTSGTTRVNGPVIIRYPDGIWYSLDNFYEPSGAASSTKTAEVVRTICPPGRTNVLSGTSINTVSINTTYQWSSIRPETGTTPTLALQPTPDSGGDILILFPPTMIFSSSPGPQIVGQYNSVYWVSIDGSSLGSEDIAQIAGVDYFLFPSGNRAESYDYVAIKRS